MGLVHAISTRPLDVSARIDERAAERAAHRALMAGDIGLEADRLRYCVQIHQTRIGVIDTSGQSHPPGAVEGHDGLICGTAGVGLMTFSADCPLVLLYDSARQVVGMVHASWRCTTAGIAPQLLSRMGEAFGTRPADVLAGIGPGAGPCCYEVKEDVYEAARALGEREALFPRRDGKMYFDLWEANRRSLVGMGVATDRIEIAGICTMCRSDLLYSFRREGAGCGHFGLMAAIAPGSTDVAGTIDND
jgi:hypothetical protein